MANQLIPVSELPGGLRNGDIDPSLIFHCTSTASKISPASPIDLHITGAEEILNKQSGLKALAAPPDFSEMANPNGTHLHQLALDMFIDRIAGYLGGDFVKLDGKVDAMAFSGGIGEKSAALRERVLQRCFCLGFALDTERNLSLNQDRVIEIGKRERSTTLLAGQMKRYGYLLVAILLFNTFLFEVVFCTESGPRIGTQLGWRVCWK